MKCYRCGFEWTPRKIKPVACPDCKGRLNVKRKLLFLTDEEILGKIAQLPKMQRFPENIAYSLNRKSPLRMRDRLNYLVVKGQLQQVRTGTGKIAYDFPPSKEKAEKEAIKLLEEITEEKAEEVKK